MKKLLIVLVAMGSLPSIAGYGGFNYRGASSNPGIMFLDSRVKLESDNAEETTIAEAKCNSRLSELEALLKQRNKLIIKKHPCKLIQGQAGSMYMGSISFHKYL